MTRTPISGGCVCGAVRYQSDAAPLAMFNCHCRACQLVSGGPYLAVVLFPSKAFRLTRGALRHHLTERVAGGGHKRGFCADCGSRITGGEREGAPSRWIGVAASSLDDPSLFRPQFDIFASHAQPWDAMDPALPKHAEYPPAREKSGT